MFAHDHKPCIQHKIHILGTLTFSLVPGKEKLLISNSKLSRLQWHACAMDSGTLFAAATSESREIFALPAITRVVVNKCDFFFIFKYYDI